MDLYRLMDQWCNEKIPFFFIIDYEQKKPLLYRLSDLKDNDEISLVFPEYQNYFIEPSVSTSIDIEKAPVPFQKYLEIFHYVQAELRFGNTYLTNLTFETPVKLSHSMEEIFRQAKAKYKLKYKNEFVCFSPETFITINNQKISTYPMKGTIDASLEDAENQLLNNEKENAEHATIVDLLRNDLSMVAQNVTVEKFRYIEKLETSNGALLQSSSEISGDLEPFYHNQYGSVLKKLLPAGSITGAPKSTTLKIISEAENYSRAYYTGVMGIFDGKDLDSAVMIRFLELKNNEYFYKSGGGITAMSNAQDEYNEMLKKIYVPVF